MLLVAPVILIILSDWGKIGPARKTAVTAVPAQPIKKPPTKRNATPLLYKETKPPNQAYETESTNIVTKVGEDKKSIEPARQISHNQNDEGRFQQMISKWPGKRPKAAIVTLLPFRDNSFSDLTRMLRSLDTHFNKEYKYPVIILVDEVMPELAELIRKRSSSQLFFLKIVPKIDEGKPSRHLHHKSPSQTYCGRFGEARDGLKQRNFCRFLTKLHEHPVLQHLDYYWRIDSDAKIGGKIGYDVFKRMKENNAFYGYKTLYDENRWCAIGVWEATEAYIKAKSHHPTLFYQLKFPKMFLTSFEISRVDFWKRGDVRDYLEFMDTLGGIYYLRWCDSAIRTHAVTLFVEKKNLYKFNDVKFDHKR
jgi:hypothetical protein